MLISSISAENNFEIVEKLLNEICQTKKQRQQNAGDAYQILCRLDKAAIPFEEDKPSLRKIVSEAIRILELYLDTSVSLFRWTLKRPDDEILFGYLALVDQLQESAGQNKCYLHFVEINSKIYISSALRFQHPLRSSFRKLSPNMATHLQCIVKQLGFTNVLRQHLDNAVTPEEIKQQFMNFEETKQFRKFIELKADTPRHLIETIVSSTQRLYKNVDVHLHPLSITIAAKNPIV